ncbi:ferrous iron transport protein B [Marinihelvus fidelis]|uniref:Ferrous iron transport protein B n=1 Tax=Marinihelvus fidelis TaxID=2613842 RepID=A0A5N0TAV9_9GAMM|nr:ferrous iron transport protein B [Marinihelvus fidelis]KAA9131808.1 ferrous iron transport protein B [Marinihelvus fidelis]
MSATTTAQVDVDSIGIRRRPRGRVAVIGNPNSGKSTLFNRLTGLRQTTGNFPGVTVEKHSGTAQLDGSAVELVDLPGIYSLAGASTDEQIAVDVILGRAGEAARPDGLMVVIDAPHIYQGLYLLQQLMELQVPTMVALTMTDAALAAGIEIDVDALSDQLGGIPVCPVATTLGTGLGELKSTLAGLSEQPVPPYPASWPALSAAAQGLADASDGTLARIDVIQGLVDPTGPAGQQLCRQVDTGAVDDVSTTLFADKPPQAEEARHRYRWARDVVGRVRKQAPASRRALARVEQWVSRPWPATVLFFLSLVLVFQAVFSWATPLMDGIDAAAAGLGDLSRGLFGDGALGSFVADGIIAGVGSVVIFLPQIVILFLFIILMEDTGYLARAAFLMDRAMRRVGLSGLSVIPMLSSFACAVPSIMATRVIPDRRDRIATILAAPFMTCSARLPIYALLIAAFVPATSVGWFNLQGLVLFGLYLLGIFGGLATAWLMKRSALRGPKPHFVLALPEFRRPNLQTVLIKLWDRCRIFLKRAGTVIFVVAVVVWALAYFPRMDMSGFTPDPSSNQSVDNQQAAAQMAQSYLGRAGKVVEPVFEPLGWDWRVSSAVIAGFPAREVVVAVMGTLYAVGAEADESSLAERLRAATWPDGRMIFTLPMVLGLMVFYAWCLQCAATVAVIRRETNSWRWPIFAWTYMTVVAYLGAFVVFRVGSGLF